MHGDMQMMQVQVPAGMSPGMQFQIQVGQQIMAIACPQGAGPGSMIQIQIPAQQPAAEAPPVGPTQQPAQQQRGELAREISTRHE